MNLSSVRSVSRTTPSKDEMKYSLMLNVVEDVPLGNSGTDYSTISFAVFAVFLEKHPATPYKRLKKPITEASIQRWCRHGLFDSRRGNVAIPYNHFSEYRPPCPHSRHIFLICDADMAELLVGIPLLKAIGFDLEKHLQNVGAAVGDMSEEELKSETARLSSTNFRGLNYEEEDDDQIKLQEFLQSGYVIDCDEVIQEAVLKAVGDAKANGMSTQRTKALKSVLEIHRNCCLVKR